MRRKTVSVWAWLLARKIARLGPNVLLILPATDRSVELARAIVRRRPCWIIKGQVIGSLSPYDPLAESVRTPAEVVNLTAGNPELGRPVISMPELIVGDGPSFIQAEYLDELRYFSIVECLLFARHTPRVLSVASRLGHRAYGLKEVRVDSDSSGDRVLSCLKSFLHPIEAEGRMEPADWCARDALAAKTPAGFSASLREDCRDLESILRMMLLNNAGTETHVRAMLGQISRYTQEADVSA